MKYLGRLFQIGTFIALLAVTSALADDPPGRVARLESMTGSVSVQPGGQGDWAQGSANSPLTNADNIWADKDSRAELNVGTGFLRIDSESSLTLTNVDNDAVQVQLHQGALNVHVGKLYGGEVYEIDTPNLAFTVTKSGDYRFDVDPNGDSTIVTVWKGEGDATGQGPAVKIHAGQQSRFTGGTSLTHDDRSAPQPDAFDQWCQERNQRADNSISARYVAPGTVGSDDLDANGTWRETPDYGPVWTPTAVAPDWAPYRYGHWINVAPWGWTWVDDAPWGFAPFHYGRWVNWGGYWGWAPGPYWVRPWYAPAMVGWFGGPRFGVGFGFGIGFGVGWAPLGWGEPFFPWWGGCSRGYFNHINISNTHITNINNVTNNYFNHNNTGGFYGAHGIAATPRYATTHNGLTAASSNTLQHSLPVASNMTKLSPTAAHNLVNSSARGPQVTPTRESTLGAHAGQPAAHPTSAAASRPTVSRMTPPASAARGNSSAAARTPQTSARGPESSAAGNKPSPSTARSPETAQSRPGAATSGSVGRSVPRPPQSMSSGNSAGAARGSMGASNTPSRSEPTQTAMNHNVPRPPSSTGNNSNRISESPNSNASRSPASNSPNATARSVPRPPQGSVSRPAESARNTAPSNSAAPRSYSSPSSNVGRSNSVPRPSGNVRSAPSYSPSNGNSGRSYGNMGGGGYSARSYGSMGSNAGSYRGGGERPTYGSPSGGRGHYSAPSHSSGGGGSHGSSGGSSHSSGGGSHGGGGHR